MFYRLRGSLRYLIFLILILVGLAIVRYEFFHRLNRIETKLLLSQQKNSNRKETKKLIERAGEVGAKRPNENGSSFAIKKRYIVYECRMSSCGGWAGRLKGVFNFLNFY